MTAPLAPERRPLPTGFDDENSPQFIPRPLRSYYATVTCPTDDFDAVAAAAFGWIERDYRHTRRYPR